MTWRSSISRRKSAFVSSGLAAFSVSSKWDGIVYAEPGSGVQAVERDPVSGRVLGAGDPRRGGGAVLA
ncbi:hypothetical protein VSS74_12235 [Conexibacter stalactiti]|uniref:Uncharacterized protein n=1 Tax=Conexibacter stalactiti TaxID=1940611 RepID=A0ABU4HP92_9ACTN|nr:hypothetical protein [Conexibacter stalactiti]MDW5595111.1 hypothetical protein [Conexibacter stalactiti]MEC5035753.1 hypothetical protein [Conexibacter stalactiti]